MGFLIGTGVAEIQCEIKDIGMMGYGMSENVVHDYSTSLNSRSVWIEDEMGGIFLYTCVEICFITPALRREVEKAIRNEVDSNFNLSQFILSAQHTHSAPGGFSEHVLYNITIPGFQKEVFDAYVAGIVSSIKLAYKNRTSGELELVEHEVELDSGIAWNRSLKAFNSNPENESLEMTQANLAIDKRMRMLRIVRGGKATGQVNWFGVHPTCVGKLNHSVSFDNKGYAAEYFENEGLEIGVFAQGPAGDISPYYHGPGDLKKRKSIKGEAEHDYAKTNGRLQFEEAKKAFSKKATTNLEGSISSEMAYFDFSNIKVDQEFSNQDETAHTGHACLGVPFFKGTRIDGRGMNDVLNGAANLMSSTVKIGHKAAYPFKTELRKEDWKEKYRVQGNKKILMDASEQRIFGTANIKGLILPGSADASIARLKKNYVNGAMSEHQWVPHVMPLQLVILGKVAFVGCPGEPTVSAGKRMEQTVLEELKSIGVESVIMCPYSNAYMGYITTFEEYQLQNYEGGHTVYGQWTLGAFQTKLKELAAQMSVAKDNRKIDRAVKPVEFSGDELSKRSS
ncbi:MAG: neutral ceramidase [Parvicellaceae bacterium]|jgi:neutral ceramidase